jgi:hypothetical protein
MIKKIRFPSKEKIDDLWQRQATEVAVKEARNVVMPGGPIPPGTPIGRLSNLEWTWIVAAVLFAWVKVRAEQATAEGLASEALIHATGRDPEPWDAGAVTSILPELAEVPGIDWTKSLTTWSRAEMIEFLVTALNLVNRATTARDLSGGSIGRKSRQPMPSDERDDPIDHYEKL